MIPRERRSDDPGALVAVRERVADNLLLALVALLVLAAIGGWVAYGAHVDPPTESIQRTVGSVETGGTYHHGAVVRSENPAYPVDAVLRDRTHYFHSVSPVLNGTFEHDYEAAGSDVTVETSLSLRIRSADGDGEYWSVTEPLAQRRVDDAGTEGTATVPFEVNVTEAARRIAVTDAGFGGSPGDSEIEIRSETAVAATVDGERVTAVATHGLPIASSGSTYTVGAAETDVASEGVSRSVPVPREYGPVASYGAVVLLLGALGGLGLVVGLHLRGSLRPTRAVRDAVAMARARKTLDEWITTGRVPPSYRTGPSVSVTSLSGLVDVAIDCDRRVIEDDASGAFYVVDGNVVYAFEPDPAVGNRSSLAEPGPPTSPVDGERESPTSIADGGAADEFEWQDSGAERRRDS